MSKGIRYSCKSVGICAAMALAVIGAAMLVDFSPASPRQNFPATKQAFRGLPGTTNRPAALLASPASKLVTNYGQLPLSFEANEGQTDGRVKFLSRGRGYSLFLTGDEAVLTLQRASQTSKGKNQKAKVEEPGDEIRNSKLETGNSKLAARRSSLVPDRRAGLRKPDDGPRTTDSVLRMKLVGANTRAAVTGAAELAGKSNYFIGNDPKKWRTNVPTYAQVKYQGVYPGVDLIYYGSQSGQLEYDFVVAPGADPSAIALEVAAVRESPKRAHRDAPLQIAANGDLVVKSDSGEVRFHKPVVYQPANPNGLLTTNHGQRTPVDGNYVLQAHHQVGFKVAAYDHTRPLFIDPVLIYSTYLGGTGTDFSYALAVDSAGSAYVTGLTYSTNFPTTGGAYQTSNKTYNSNYTAFVTKLNPAGTALVYSTYLGGNNNDYADGIAVDSAGDAYVTGGTNSSDFPTVNAIQVACNGGSVSCATQGDAFVTELSPNGSALVYSTYLGGNNVDSGNSIAVDSSGSAYVTGQTVSTNFPTTSGAFQTSYNAYQNNYTAFVTKLSPGGTALVYSTYLGGNVYDVGTSVALDSSGNAYVAGVTASTDFPLLNAYQSTNKDTPNGTPFVTKLNPTGTGLVYSTFLGGSSGDFPYCIVVDFSGNAYVTGYATSTDFPLLNAYQSTNKAAKTFTGFVSKLNPAGSGLVYSTYLGGSVYDAGFGIGIDSSGDAFVTGATLSSDFPTANPIQAACNGGSGCEDNGDGFVAELSPNGSALVFSTFLGGSQEDTGNSIAIDSQGNAYVAGTTNSPDFPTANPLQATLTGVDNAFMAKILSSASATAPAVSLSSANLAFAPQNVETTSAPLAVTLSNTGNAALAITNLAASANFAVTIGAGACGSSLAAGASCAIYVTFTPSTTGTLIGALAITDNNNGNSGSTQTVSLSGTGIAAAVALQSIAVTPGNPSIMVGTTQQFTATGTYSDGSTQNLTSAATWTSSATGVAAMSAAGLASAVGTGPTTIEAASGVINGLTTLTVVTPSAIFVPTGSLNIARNTQTATLLTNGMVLIAGGEAGNTPIATAELYNPATGTFTPTGSLNTARYDDTATLLNNGMVLIVGGFGPGDVRLASAELYNPTTGTFTYTGNLNTVRWDHTATLLNNGMVLIAGGFPANGGVPLASAELYNPSTGTFASLGNMNAARVGHTATLLNNGMVLLAGGANQSIGSGYLGLTASAELYDPSTATFTPTGNLNTARWVQTATLLNNGLVLLAGGQDAFYNPFASAELYNPTTGLFTYTGNMNVTREDHTATLLTNGLVLVAGGYGITVLDSAEIYDPAAGTFTLAGGMNSARFEHTATLLANGLVLIAAGDGTNNNPLPALAIAELYEPATLAPPNLLSIALAPGSSAVPLDTAQRFTAAGTFSDGSTQQLASVTWSSSDSTLVSVTNDASNLGAAYALANGLVTVSACAGAVCGSATVTAGITPVAGASPPSLTFSSQNVGTTSASQPVILSNTGTGALTIASIATSDDFGQTNTCAGNTVAAGTSCTINVTFSPTATGALGGTLTITDNSGLVTGSTQTVGLTGTGAAPVAGVSPPLTFGGQVVGTTSASQPVTVSNTTGTAPLAIASIAISGTDAASFAVASAGTTCSTSSPVPAGSSCRIEVTFSPTATGPLSGTLTVTDNSNEVNGTMQTVVLTGTGTAPVANLSSTLTFTGQNVLTTSAAQALTLSNATGTAPLTITSMAISGTNASSFAVASTGTTCSTSTPVAAGSSCTINVTFTPTAAGALTATLTVTDNTNGVAGSTQAATLNGTGIGVPVASLSATASIVFSNQLVSTTSAAQTETVTNTGTANLSISTATIGGTNAGDFTKSADTCTGATLTTSGASSSCAVSVTFTPAGTSGRSGTLTFTDNNNNVAGSTQAVVLTGTGTAPVAGVSPPSLTFSSQSMGTTSAGQAVTLSNATGTAPLTLSNIAITGANASSFAVASPGTTCSTSSPVASGGSCTISVTFSPTATGSLTGTLTFTDNSNGVAGSTQTVGLTGTGTGNTPVGTGVTPSLPSSPGVPPATVTFASVTTGGTTAVTASTACSTSSPANFSVGTGAGAVCVDVSTTAVFTGAITITVSFNPANYPNPPGPQIFHLVGGVWVNVTSSVNFTNDTITAVVTSLSPFGLFVGTPEVSLSGTNQNFSSVVVNASSSPQQVTLTNSGAANLTVSTATLGGTNATEFAKSADTCTAATLLPNGTCSVTITFTPKAAGTRTATLTFTDNAASSPQTVALSGTGEDFSLAAASGSSTSATVTPGEAAIFNLTVSSLGGLDQPVTFTCTSAPVGIPCAFSSNPVTPGSGLLITAYTTAPSVIAPRSRPLPPAPPLPPGLKGLVTLAVLLAGLAWAIARRNQPGASWWRTTMVPLTAGLLLMLALAGCGGGGPAATPGTPAGTYTLTVTGTVGSGSTAVSHNLTLTLSVT